MTRTFAVALAAGCLALTAIAHADDPDDPGTGQEICGAYNLGVPPSQIPDNLHHNDGRWNYWRGQRETEQRIVGGDCG